MSVGDREGRAPAAESRAPARAARSGSSFEAKMLTPALLRARGALDLPVHLHHHHEPLAGGADRRDLASTGPGWTTGRGCSATGRCGAAWLRSIVYFVLTVGLEMVLGDRDGAVRSTSSSGARASRSSLILLPMFMAPVIVGLLGRFLTDSTYGLYAWLLQRDRPLHRRHPRLDRRRRSWR